MVLLAVTLAGGALTSSAQNVYSKLSGAAAIFVVNSTADPGDGVCDAVECTFREAIAAANDNPGQDTIQFNIPRTARTASNRPPACR